jgi:hypothetical protein
VSAASRWRALTAVALIAGSVTPASGQSATPAGPDAATRTELVAARDAIWRAWFGNDTLALARLLPEAAAAGSDGSWEDRRAILDGSRRFVAGGGTLVSLEFRDTDISLFGSVAVVRSAYRYEVQQGGKTEARSGLATEVFVRRNGIWINPFWHLGHET